MILVMQPFNCDPDLHVREVSDIVFTDDMLSYINMCNITAVACEGLLVTTENMYYLVCMSKTEFQHVLDKLNGNTPVYLTCFLTFGLDRDNSDDSDDLNEFINKCQEHQVLQSDVFK